MLHLNPYVLGQRTEDEAFVNGQVYIVYLKAI